MVNTRQHNSGVEINSELADGNAATGDLDPPSQPGGMSDKSAMDNDSDLEPLVPRRRTRTSWRNGLRNSYPTRYRRTIGRESRLPMRSCRLRIVAADSEDDILDDSDLQYNDDDDEPLYSAIKPRRNYRRSTRRISRRTVAAQEAADDDYQQQNGVKDDDDEAEEPGIRRSTRQKKLLYGSFNQSWILGTGSLRGYPDMYDDHERDPGHTSNSNEAPIVNSQETVTTEEPKTDELVAAAADDMYSKVKRTRRARIQYSPEPELRGRLRPRLRRARVTVADSEETESETAASSDEGGRRGRGQRRRVYHLRQNKPIVQRFQIDEPPRRSSTHVISRPFTARDYRNQRKRRDSTSDEERFQRKKTLSLAKARSRCMPLNFKPTESGSLQKTPTHSGKLSGAPGGPKGPADVDPMSIDTSVKFDKVGGLENHLRCLKEMVVFPMLYKEVFDQYKVQPPKGILFHGPPGTGKTLIARALANECSQGERKVAFFMRKGADCLSKWVGESERQLRLLFEQAHQMRPSIIFFDEIDGLAPVRSSKQDQIHASIVSTLLALLDGLDDRGDIIVIGATNRIDAIDPALRRPGRFDRELYFPLPGMKERVEILKIHTKPWACPPTPETIANLAQRSVGYCGADLRLLCSEAVVGAMRRRYPQIYKSSKKLLLQPDQVKVVDKDLTEAQSKIVPASCRVSACPRSRLSVIVAPLLNEQFDSALTALKSVFPHAGVTSVHERVTKSVYKPRFLVYASNGQFGQTSHIAPALLDAMEHIPVHMLSLDTLLDSTNRSSEEAVIQIIREAARNPPSVLYLPAVDTWWDLLPPTTHQLLLDRVAQIASDASVLVLATAHSKFEDIHSQIQSLFAYDRVEITAPSFSGRAKFWETLLLEETMEEPPIPPVPEDELEELPLAPSPEPPAPDAAQLEELHNAEEQRLRELRLFLRDICAKLARNRQFFLFTKPVDTKEVPDYLKIIKKPMDLETVMANIDLHLYNCAQEFLTDIDLIVSNALEYNPARASEDKLIRHRAYMLRDTAYTLIKAEMDTDFEEECRKITKRRKEAKEKELKTEISASNGDEDDEDMPLCNGTVDGNHTVSPEIGKRQRSASQAGPSSSKSSNGAISSDRARRRKCSWAKGMITARRKNKVKADDTEGTTETSSTGTLESNVDGSSKHRAASPLEREPKKPRGSDETDGPKQDSPPTAEEGTPKKRPRKNSTRKLTMCEQEVSVDIALLEGLHRNVTAASADWSLDTLLGCRARMNRVIEVCRDRYDRQQLPMDLEEAFNFFATLEKSS